MSDHYYAPYPCCGGLTFHERLCPESIPIYPPLTEEEKEIKSLRAVLKDYQKERFNAKKEVIGKLISLCSKSPTLVLTLQELYQIKQDFYD